MSDQDHFVCLQSIDIDIVISTCITTTKAPNLNQSNHQNIHLLIIFPVSVIYMTRELRVFIQSKCCSWWKKLLMKVPTLVKDVVKKARHRDDRQTIVQQRAVQRKQHSAVLYEVHCSQLCTGTLCALQWYNIPLVQSQSVYCIEIPANQSIELRGCL